MQPRTMLFGDSHSYAIQRAIERREKKSRPVPLTAHRLLKVKNGKTMGDTSFEDFLRMIRPLTESDVVLSVVGGNQHAVFSTIQHPQRFDFMEPAKGDHAIAESDEIIPYRILSKFFAAGIRGRDGKSLEALRKATSARIVHIIPPPPKRDNAFIEAYHETRFASEGIASLGVSPPELRMKFWRLQTQMLTELCSELNIEVMLPPPTALDEDGFLAPDYYDRDATHANPSYGELLLAQIEGFLQSDGHQEVEAS